MNFAYRLVTDGQGRIEYKQRPGRKKHFHLAVYLDEPEETIAGIRLVEYHLHESFADPVRHNDDAGSRFTEGFFTWGKFPIEVTVLYRDGRRECFRFNLDWSLPPDYGLNYVQVPIE